MRWEHIYLFASSLFLTMDQRRGQWSSFFLKDNINTRSRKRFDNFVTFHREQKPASEQKRLFCIFTLKKVKYKIQQQ